MVVNLVCLVIVGDFFLVGIGEYMSCIGLVWGWDGVMCVWYV